MQETVRRYRSRSRYIGGRSADLGWQDRVRQYANRYGYVQDHDVRRSRMTFDIELPDRAADMSPVYEGVRRTATRSEELERLRRERSARSIPLVARQGVRGTVALALVAVLIAGLSVFWLFGRAQIRQIDARTERNVRRAAEIERRCKNLDLEYEARAAEIDVLYSAVEQGMISAKGAQRIYLEVPEEICMMPVGNTVN